MFKALALSLLVAQAMADTTSLRSNAQQQRRLSFSDIVGYKPRSQVTDHAAISLDQQLLETALGDKNFDLAAEIYANGGNSKSYARLIIDGGVPAFIKKKTVLTTTDTSGNTITGVAYADTDAGSASLFFQYDTSDNQDAHVKCRVGAIPLDQRTTDGCVADASGAVSVTGGAELTYTYALATGNVNGRTLKGFSTGAEDKMLNCANCPYSTFLKFHNYYKTSDYGDQWITSAFSQTNTAFPGLGNQNVGGFSDEGRVQVIKKGTAYMNVWMYVIRELEDAIDDCKNNCINCNDEPVHAWDEAVAFYAGSLEGTDGSGEGNFLYGLSDKRCADFRTCGEDQNEIKGTSKNNIEIIRHFKAGQNDLLNGQCPEAKKQKDIIEKLMIVPLVQGTMRYAYINDYQAAVTTGDKALAEGSVFAASVLPLVHDCNADDAQFIYDNMRQGFGSPNFKGVKQAFERNYECMGITCSAVGGLYDGGDLEYLEHAGPCTDAKKNRTGAIVGGVIGGLVGALLLIFIFMKCRKSGSSGKDTSFVEGNIDPNSDTTGSDLH